MLKAISANRLPDGTVVYLGRGGGWVTRLAEARVFTAKADADAAFLLAQEDTRRNLVVEPSLIDVAGDEGALRPLTLRETIRAHGPTINYLPQRRNVCGRKALPQKPRWPEAEGDGRLLGNLDGELDRAQIEAAGAAAAAYEAAR